MPLSLDDLAAEGLAITDLAQHDTVRLIPTARHKPPALAVLADDDDAMDDLAALESVTNERLQAQRGGLPGLDARELVYRPPSHTFVNAAFTHRRPGGNRFNDEARGAWYAAFELETGQAEVAYHLSRELEAVGRFDNVTDYAEMIADFIGPFHDLRAVGPGSTLHDTLDPDTVVGYPAGQALARELLTAHDSNGLVYPSVGRAHGTCLVAFHPSSVQNVRQGAVWRFSWDGAPAPTIEPLATT